MPSKKSTTVVFTKEAQKIKNRLSAAFGLKGLLSAAIQYFDELDDTEKIKRVAEANKQEDAVHEKPLTLRQALRRSVKKTGLKKKSAEADTGIGILIEIHPSDQKLWNELRRAAGLADEIVSAAEADSSAPKQKKGSDHHAKSG